MDDNSYRIDPGLLPEGLPDVLGSAAGNPAAWPARRAQILEMLSREVYGYAPPPPEGLIAEVISRDDTAYAGKAVHTTYSLSFDTPGGRFAFPFHLMVPPVDRPPLFIHIAFRPDLPDRYCPVEEILDRGFALASFCYQDVAPDADDGFGRLAGCYAWPIASRTGGQNRAWPWAAACWTRSRGCPDSIPAA